MLKNAIKIIESKIIKSYSVRRRVRVQLDITNACNLACSHCYHSDHSDVGSITIDQWYSILDQVKAFTSSFMLDPEFVICGGEPMASRKLLPILDRIFGEWPQSSTMLLTNGTITPQKVLDGLRSRSISVQVSLDGPDSDRHDEVRGKGSFDKTVAGIERFKSVGIAVQILSILSQRTVPWIGDFFANAKELSVDCQNFTRLISVGQGAKLTEHGIDRPLFPSELRKAYIHILQQSVVYGVPTNTYQPLYALIDREFGSKGLFGLGDIVIDYKGQLKISSRTNHVVGSLLSNDLETLYLNDPILNALQNGQVNGCKDCKLFTSCGGDRNASYATFGSFLEKDPGCWIN
jgi:AdoMet-dependent heme synthase